MLPLVGIFDLEEDLAEIVEETFASLNHFFTKHVFLPVHPKIWKA